MGIFSFTKKITPFLRNILFGKDIIQQDLVKVFLEQIEIDGYCFVRRVPFVLNKPTDKDVSNFFNGLCEKVYHFLKYEMQFKEVAFQDIRFGDQIVSSKIRVTFYDDLFLVGMVYFLEKESYDLWRPLIAPNDLDFLLNHTKIPEYLNYPKEVPVRFSGSYGKLSSLKDTDFEYCQEYFFKVM